jgi:DNA mismatch repair ATPase MutL
VRSYLVSSLRQNLLTEGAAPNVMDHTKVNSSELPKTSNPQDAGVQVDINYISLTSELDRYDRILSDQTASDTDKGREAPMGKGPHERFLFSDLQILGNAFANYILAQKEDSLYLIDQHAAHERVLYEQLMDAIRNHTADSQMMIDPWIVEIPLYLREVAAERLTLLNGLGYHIQEFGPKEYIVKEIPACMDPREAEAFLNDVLNSEPGSGRVEPEQERSRLITQACKAAVKANDRLDVQEIRSLLRSLDETENPFSCPHGRPTFLRFSQNDLEKMFLRK